MNIEHDPNGASRAGRFRRLRFRICPSASQAAGRDPTRSMASVHKRCRNFLDQWGREAERLGWGAEELFGLHPDAPMARYDRMGLIWMLKGECVVALTAAGAKLSSELTFYRKG
jgi:hypothetical protein